MRPKLYPPKKQKLISGVNDLLTLFPNISQELFSHNPSQILAGSNTKVTWKCVYCSKIWESPVRSRTTSIQVTLGCPDCSSKTALTKRFQKILLKEEYPGIFWQLTHPESHQDLTIGSREIVEWNCEGHTYFLDVNKKVSGRPCPYCSFRKVFKGFNDISGVRPDLVKHLANKGDAFKIANSKEIVWWQHKAEDGKIHKWPAPIYKRVYENQRCKVCTDRHLQIGVNDFATYLKRLDLEWSESNIVDPTTFSYKSMTRVILKCHRHPTVNLIEGQAGSFSTGKTYCQDCISQKDHFRSKREDEVANFIKSLDQNFKIERNVRRFKKYGLYEIDILVDGKYGIHFDGDYWHQEGVFKPVGYHKERDRLMSSLGLKNFVVKEHDWVDSHSAVENQLKFFLKRVLNS